jgi:hypothetical protein
MRTRFGDRSPDLTGPGYELDAKVRIQLESKVEMKERGVDSPDDGDALALTFARNVATRQPAFVEPPRSGFGGENGAKWME